MKGDFVKRMQSKYLRESNSNWLKMHRRFSRTVSTLLLLTALALHLGCQDSPSQNQGELPSSNKENGERTSTESELDDGALAIWKQCTQNYASTNTYQDKAILNLQYRLDGRWIEEFHPQSVAFERGLGLSVKMFHGRIQSDRNRFTCYIYDSATGNLDEQTWIRENLKQAEREIFSAQCWTELLSDPIAKHFLSGESEIPLRKNDVVPDLFPPAIGLLTNHGELNSAWSNPKSCRLVELDDQDFHVLDLGVNELRHRVWIDRNTSLIQRIQYDSRVLSPVLQESSDVTDLKLIVNFGPTSMNQASTKEIFETRLSDQQKPVEQFVKLPESFPSRLIGQPVPEFDMHSNGGAQIASRRLKGLTTCLFFLQTDFIEQDSLTKYLELADQLRDGRTRIAVVICGQPEVAKRIREQCESQSRNVTIFVDPYYASMKNLEVRHTPTVVVLDSETKIQFFKNLSNDPWKKEVSTAIQRIRRGENIAAEMKKDYQRFLESYHQKVNQANPFRNASAKKPGDNN